MGFKEICLVLLITATIAAATVKDRNNKPYKVVCTYASWATYRQGDGQFLIEHIDPNQCTHLIYMFVRIKPREYTIEVIDEYSEIDLGGFKRFNNLKKLNPNLSTLVSIGGINEGSALFSVVAGDLSIRPVFVKSAVAFCQKYGFDGLDMAWEYPARGDGSSPDDKQSFVSLLKDLSEAFEPHGLLLTVSAAPTKTAVELSYEVPEMFKYVDFVNVLTFDFHSARDGVTGHHTSMYSPHHVLVPEQRELSVNHSMSYWIDQGAPRSKLVLGMAMFGKSFTLSDPNEHGLGAPNYAPGRQGPFTLEDGFLGYDEIRLLIKSTGWTEKFVTDVVKAPYAYKDDQWACYDNVKSIGIKLDYLIKRKLGGGVAYLIDSDDFRGKYSGERFPLLSTIASKLNRIQPPPPLTSVEHGKCTSAGPFPDPQDCSRYYMCGTAKVGTYTWAGTYSCGDGLVFNKEEGSCVPAGTVKGC